MGQLKGQGDPLWERARAGDAAAFGEVFDEHRDRIFEHALQLTQTLRDAENLTALVFLETWRQRTSVRAVDGSIGAWLIAATDHVSKNSKAITRRHRAVMAALPLVAPTTSFTPTEATLGGAR